MSRVPKLRQNRSQQHASNSYQRDMGSGKRYAREKKMEPQQAQGQATHMQHVWRIYMYVRFLVYRCRNWAICEYTNQRYGPFWASRCRNTTNRNHKINVTINVTTHFRPTAAEIEQIVTLIANIKRNIYLFFLYLQSTLRIALFLQREPQNEP